MERLSKAAMRCGVPLGMANYCFRSEALGPILGIDVHRYRAVDLLLVVKLRFRSIESEFILLFLYKI